jgi:hypothetical protein
LLAAAGLVVALALGTAPTAAAPAGLAASTRPEDPNVLVFQRRCIDAVIGQAVGQGQSEDAVVAQINRECLVPRRGQPSSPAGLRLLSCDRPFPVRLRPVTKLIAGCLSG